MAKKIIRLTESDLHRIVKRAVNRIIRESKGIDATEYIDNNTDKYLSKNGMYGGYASELDAASKMPEGYDDDLDFDNFTDIERVASLNRPYTGEVYPSSKEIENNASWDAIDDEYGAPIDDGSAENFNIYDSWK